MRSVFLFVLLFASFSVAQTGRVYQLSGTHSRFGSFVGELEVRQSGTETVEVVRVVTYDQFKFDGLRVQEIWIGPGSSKNGVLDVMFNLKQADVFNRVDGESRTREQFKQDLSVRYSANFTRSESVVIETPTGLVTEFVGPAMRGAASEPLWKDERQKLASYGTSHQTISNLAWKTIFAPIRKKFENDPFVKSYSSRPECQSTNQYFVFDPTDFDFLRAHPDSIRVANKVVDPISMTEAELRHDAYAFSLAEKARMMDRDFVDHHLNELGLYATALFDGNGQAGFVANGDGALWSGMYAGAQAMRYLVTKEPEALENFKRVTKGLMLLMDVTGNAAEFGRTAEPMKADEVLKLPWRQGVAPYENVKYIEGGNNDMIKGLFHAFAWAFVILPSSDDFLKEVSAHAIRLPNLKPAKSFQHVGNREMSAALAFLASGDSKWLKTFETSYRWGVRTADVLGLDHGFYNGGVADWSGINLGEVSNVTEVLLIQKILERNPANKIAREALRKARQNLVDLWSVYATARRDFVTIAADAFALTNLAGLTQDTQPVKWDQQAIWPRMREQAVWLLREVPAIQTRKEISFDFTWRPDFCLSRWPHLPWKALSENPPMSFFYQAQTQMTVFESAALESDNMWTGAFGYAGASSKAYRHGRMDYLHMYWMARFSGYLQAND